MKALSVADAQSRLAELVNELDEGPVLLVRNGRPCAALVGLAEPFNKEAFTLGRNKRLRQLIDEACQHARSRGTPFAQILAEINTPIRNKTRRRSGDRHSKRRSHAKP